MIEPTDIRPPPDAERARVRISLTSAILIGLIGSGLAAAATWGATTERIVTLERTVAALDRQNGELRTLALSQDRQITELRALNSEIIRRLDRIERKIDERER